MRWSALAGGLAVFGSTFLVPAAAPHAVATVGRTLSVTPSAGLGNQVVRVSWTGFQPTTSNDDFTVVVFQCRANPTTLRDCFTGEPFPQLAEGTRQIGRTGPDGTGSIEFEVRPAANLPLLGCSQSTPCSILAYENDGVPPPADGLPLTSVVAPLEFAPSQADCPPITDFDLRADGAASSAPLFYRWAAEICVGESPLVLDFTETSSTGGRENFLADLVDIGVTSLAATEEELEEHPDHRDFAYVPVSLTAITVVLNMRDPFTGNRLEDVVLSPRLVMRLITDTSVAGFLSDPELRALNPRTRFPSIGLSTPLLRAERNADTRLVTRWLADDPAAMDFLAGNDAFGVQVTAAYKNLPYPRDNFENVAQTSEFLPRTGQRNVALRMFYGVRPIGVSRENTSQIGFIGIVDLPTARRFGLPTARVVNPVGVAVGPTDDGVTAGFSSMLTDSHGLLISDPNSTNSAAYPLVKVDYAMVPLRPATQKKASDLRRFLQYAVGPGQSVLPPGYLPLPATLRDQALTVIASIQGPDDVASTTTTTTTTTTVASLPPTTANTFNPNFGGGSTSGGSTSGPTFVPDVVEEVPEDTVPTATTSTSVPDDASSPRPTSTEPAPVAEQPPLPPLPVPGDRALLPAMQATSGLALAAWGAGELRPTWRRLRSLRRRT